MLFRFTGGEEGISDYLIHGKKAGKNRIGHADPDGNRSEIGEWSS